jgi:polygalacturonase
MVQLSALIALLASASLVACAPAAAPEPTAAPDLAKRLVSYTSHSAEIPTTSSNQKMSSSEIFKSCLKRARF